MAELIIQPKVTQFIKGLEKPTTTKTLRMLISLENLGYELREPHTKKLTKNIYELRTRGQQEIRLLFGYKDNKIIVVTGFIKKTRKTPRSEIERAEREFKALDI